MKPKRNTLVMSRNLEDITNLKVENFVFEQVEDFKYLVVNINYRNNVHSEVRQRINAAANRAYFAMNKMLSSEMLSWKTKEKLYTCHIRLIVTYACETWSTTKSDENKLLSFERKV